MLKYLNVEIFKLLYYHWDPHVHHHPPLPPLDVHLVSLGYSLPLCFYKLVGRKVNQVIISGSVFFPKK